MNNLVKLKNVFSDVFGVDASELGTDFNNKSVDGWDSVRQLSLVAALEDAFDIFMDPEDIITCNSYEGVQKVLQRYNIDL